MRTADTPAINHREESERVGRSNESSQTSAQSDRWHSCAPLILLGVILVLTALLRIRMLSVPLERDEGEYAYFGQLMLDGLPPYQYAYSMKLPGIYYAYAVSMALFGRDIAGIHTGFLLVNLFTIVLMYLLAKQLSGYYAAISAAAVYAVLSADAGVLGFHAHATHYVVLFAVLGAFLLLRAIQSENRVLLVLSGLSMGMGFLMKQHGIFFIIFGLLWTAAVGAREWLKRWLTRLMLFGIASVIPYAAVCLAMYLSGVFSKFWFWTVVYARAYTSEMNLRIAQTAFTNNFRALLVGPLWLWILGGVAIAGLLSAPRLWRKHAFTLLFFLCSAAAVCPGFFFRPHYFVLFLPALALVISVGFAEVHHRLDRTLSGLLRSLPTMILALAVGISLYRGRAYFFQYTPVQEVRFTYGLTNPFPEAMSIAKYLREHTKPSDKISIFGSEPEILFYAHRLSATGHIYTYGLMESQPYAQRMQHEFIEQTEQSAPAFAVFVPFNNSWTATSNSVPDLWQWMPGFLDAHYDRVGLINIEANKTDYFWEEDALKANPAPLHILVLRRRQ